MVVNERGFYQHSRQTYAKSARLEPLVVDEIMVTAPHSEFALEWRNIRAVRGDESVMVVRMFEDAFDAFTEYHEFFAWLATRSGKNPQPDEVIDRLLALGFKDESHTPRAKTAVQS